MLAFSSLAHFHGFVVWSAGPNDLSFSSVYLAVKKAESLLDSGENHCEQIFACLPCWQWAIILKNRVFRTHV